LLKFYASVPQAVIALVQALCEDSKRRPRLYLRKGFDNKECQKELDFEFNSIEKAVKDTAERFLEEN
jgi:hypothetical protein